MNELQVIKEQPILGKQFRIYGTPEEPLFLAKDVAEWIEHSDVSTMVRLVDASEKVTNIVCTLGGNQEALFLTEDGLYEVLMQSRKENAKLFKAEVKKVLKSIRKTGGYVANEDAFISTYLPFADEPTKHLFRVTLHVINEQNARIEADKPLVLFANSVETSKSSILIGDLAKLIKQNGVDMGQQRLFTWMRNNGYLIRHGERYNTPTQRAMEMGLFEVKESTVNNPDGSIRVTKTTKVTGKGQVYFINKFLGKEAHL